MAELEAQLAQQDKQLSQAKTANGRLTKLLSQRSEEAAYDRTAVVDKIKDITQLTTKVNNLREEVANLYEIKETYLEKELGFPEEWSYDDCFDRIKEWKDHWYASGLGSSTEEDSDDEDDEDDGSEDGAEDQDPAQENKPPGKVS